MTKRLHPYICACFAGLCLGACDSPPAGYHADAPEVNGAHALDLVAEFVALGPRISGTPGAQKAAAWIAKESRALVYSVEVQEWRETTDAGSTTFRNVVALKPGHPRRRILLGSHYDTKFLPEVPGFTGANDSGSSTGLLLEIMRQLAEQQLPRNTTLECVFFDGEECRTAYGPSDGLHGSRHHAAAIQEAGTAGDYLAVIVLDMVGDKDLSVTLPMDTDGRLARQIFDIAEGQGVRDAFGYFPRGSILDDHKPFQDLGIPSVDIIDFEFGPGNRYWHTGEDTMDKLSAQSLEVVGNVTLELIWRIAAEKNPVRH